jgi:isoleucyl-tRNA synthetase
VKKGQDSLQLDTSNLGFSSLIYIHTFTMKQTTSFSQRANARTTEPQLQERWFLKPNYSTNKDAFFLHDGPPYANGKVHMGHALNKVLKDTANRAASNPGRFVPGFDCHGLPTEMKVLQSLSDSEKESLTPFELRQKCREYATQAVEQQKSAFQRLGVLADWDNAYLTMSPEYEAAQLEAFGELYFSGYLYRDLKETWWSESSQTVLAEAELEYAAGSEEPLDWRTKQPVERRTTLQWFVSMENLLPQALAAAQDVDWGSPQAANRFLSMLKDRPDWCVSRQRVWGLPLPFFYDSQTHEPLLTRETLSHLCELFRAKTSDCWWELTTEELLPPQYRNGSRYYKGTDTMDVWLDSGLSWYAVSKNYGLQFPADAYLEGSDQHRGWFQSSLLTSVALTGKAPYKRVVTHGFVLDENGRKMSKSEGNTLDPLEVMDTYSADVLRLWALTQDHTKDLQAGERTMSESFEFYKKLRNTCRFGLSNLFDFAPENRLPLSSLLPEDQEAVAASYDLREAMLSNFQDFQFHPATKLLREYLSNTSAHWFGTEKTGLKARLYQFYEDMGGTPDSYERRSGQTALELVLKNLTDALEPALPHLATETKEYLFLKESF